MNRIKKHIANKKGINTILAALLMVVIVVVASVMVYAWSTGLLGSLMGSGTGNVGKEALNMDSYAFNTNNQNVTLYIRDSGTAAVSLQTYYIKDNSGNSWQLQNWSPTGNPLQPNTVAQFNLGINCAAGGCQYTGTANAFNTFVGGNSYTITVVTTRNTQFTFTVTR